jgi:hypothetical protein
VGDHNKFVLFLVIVTEWFVPFSSVQQVLTRIMLIGAVMGAVHVGLFPAAPHTLSTTGDIALQFPSIHNDLEKLTPPVAAKKLKSSPP